MYPRYTHLIKLNNRYLGKHSYVLGFIKEAHAQQVVKTLKYASPVLRISDNTFVINRKPSYKQIAKYAIDAKKLAVQSMEISVGSFFTSINNVELKLIDDVLVDKRTGVMVLKSEFMMDEMVPLEENDMVDQLERLIEVKPYTEIDYANMMSNIIIDRYMVVQEDEDFLE